jgi:predicted GNAT family acetyltransferase
MTTQLVHEADSNRYVMNVDDSLVAVADYRSNDTSISFTHTFTEPAHRGKGYAADLVTFAIDDVESSSTKKVIPVCWYVAEWFEAHPERAELLSR